MLTTTSEKHSNVAEPNNGNASAASSLLVRAGRKRDWPSEAQEHELRHTPRAPQVDRRHGQSRLDRRCGPHPTYAAIKRHDSKLTVEEILFHCGLDTRPGQRPDRTMMTLNCRWMNQSIKILNCHCPSSKNQSGNKTREEPTCPTYSTLLASYHSISEAALQSLPLGSWAAT